MPTLTKNDRVEVITDALNATFLPLLKDWEERVAVELLARNQAAHPHFYELWADEANRQYLSVSHNVCVYTEVEKRTVSIRRPDIDSLAKDVNVDTTFALNGRWDNQWDSVSLDVLCPASNREIVLEEDHPLIVEYAALIQQFSEAHSLLVSTLYSYKQREKFEVDFPDLARYLPTRVTTMAVAVKVEDVITKLAKVGIPPKALTSEVIE